MTFHRPPRPGALRISAAAIVVTAAATAAGRIDDDSYRWWLAGAAIVLIALFVWWRGLYLTTIGGRFLALVGRNRGWRRSGVQPIDVRTTVMLRIDSGPTRNLPLPIIVSYLNRYGIRCRSIRVTSRDPHRVTWVSLTMGAADNLTALEGRSSSLPLHETASVVRRRLADHLRELGWAVDSVHDTEAPLPAATIRERWRGVQSSCGYVTAYRIAATEVLLDVIERVHQLPAEQTWTTIEFTGERDRPQLSVACALVTTDRPTSRLLIDGVTPEAGRHRPALEAMRPSSVEQLKAKSYPIGDGLAALSWPVADGEASVLPRVLPSRHSLAAEPRSR